MVLEQHHINIFSFVYYCNAIYLIQIQTTKNKTDFISSYYIWLMFSREITFCNTLQTVKLKHHNVTIKNNQEYSFSNWAKDMKKLNGLKNIVKIIRFLFNIARVPPAPKFWPFILETPCIIVFKWLELKYNNIMNCIINYNKSKYLVLISTYLPFTFFSRNHYETKVSRNDLYCQLYY